MTLFVRQTIVAATTLVVLSGCVSRPMRNGPVVRPDGTFKGVNHLTSHADENDYPLRVFAEKLRWAKEAGVEVSRGPHLASWMTQRHFEHKRQMVRMMSDAGIVAVPIIVLDSRHTIGAWRVFVRKMVSEIPAKRYSIGNEPDNDPDWPPDKYAVWLKVASQEIRAARPRALIHAPSVGHGKAYAPLEYLVAIDIADYDVLTIHPYHKGWTYVLQMLAAVPNIPVWIEEDGDTGWFKDDAMRGSFHEYLNHARIECVLWYAFCDYALPEFNMLDFELDTRGHPTKFTPRPIFHTFKNIR